MAILAGRAESFNQFLEVSSIIFFINNGDFAIQIFPIKNK